MNITVVLEILSFLASHKDDIKELILALESVTVDGVEKLSGSAKADVVKGYIATATNVVDQIEAAWPIVSPIFNAVVAAVKGK